MEIEREALREICGLIQSKHQTNNHRVLLSEVLAVATRALSHGPVIDDDGDLDPRARLERHIGKLYRSDRTEPEQLKQDLRILANIVADLIPPRAEEQVPLCTPANCRHGY